jgi:hypothetical protein
LALFSSTPGGVPRWLQLSLQAVRLEERRVRETDDGARQRLLWIAQVTFTSPDRVGDVARRNRNTDNKRLRRIVERANAA